MRRHLVFVLWPVPVLEVDILVDGVLRLLERVRPTHIVELLRAWLWRELDVRIVSEQAADLLTLVLVCVQLVIAILHINF